MVKIRLFMALGLVSACLFGSTHSASAQGITSGSVAGVVTDSSGAPIEAAQVQVTNRQTGVTQRGQTREGGRYSIAGLEPGGPYTVVARRIGFAPSTHENVRVPLGNAARVDFALTRQAAVLTGVRVQASASSSVIAPTRTGASTTISDSALRNLPTLSRNFTDFVTLVPQVTQTSSAGASSGGGVNIRQNSIQIDGAQAGDLFGLGTTGQPGSQANAKSIPLDAVKEYQVLLSPFDVRQGNFGGILINAVTKSGTNDFHGSAYGYTRNQQLTRSEPYLTDFLQQQYGFSLGGPIIKNHLFFFVNPEFQRFRTPTNGPFIGSADAPVNQPTIDRFNSILANQYGFTQGGTGAQVLRENPTTNVFARLDAYLPGSTRLVLRHNYAYAENTSFGRGLATSATPNFGLTSNSYLFTTKTHSSVAEFLSNFTNGVFNELLFNYSTTSDYRTVPALFPQVTVNGVPRSDGNNGTVNFIAGTESSSQGNSLDQRTFEVTENLTIPIGAHKLTVGTKNLFYRSVNLFGQNSRGSWTFANLDSLAKGVASRYQVSAPASTDPNNGIATIPANLYAFYAQDVWQATGNFNVTLGARLDIPHFTDRPPFNPSVFSAYGRSTSDVPTRRSFSPRIGFNWDITGDQRNQLRGGIGYFSGTPPFVYLSNAFGNSGLSGYASLTCSGSTSGTTSQLAPAFNQANIANPPTQCAPSGTKPGATVALGSAINTIDPHFRFPQYQKISAAYDHRFANGLLSTVEGLYTHAIANPFYTNIALAGPQGVDRNGRILYGNLIATGGTPTTLGPRTQVLEVTDVSGDYTYSVTGTVQKTFGERFDGSLSYTFSQARDVGTVTSSTAGSNYRYGRDVAGYLENRSLTRSKNDQPHRIIGYGTYRLPTKTDISVIYTGNSGAPYDYVYGAGSGTGSGDANADGNSQNDLVYVPRDVRDPKEILFTGYNDPTKAQSVLNQQVALDRFINSVQCLRDHRGQLLSRNACRNPWENDIDLSIAQSLEAFHAQNITLRLDIFNFGNLLNPKWGRQFFSDQNSTCGANCSATVLVTQSANKVQSPTNPSPTQGVYTFDANLRQFNALNAESNYRMQLSLRYSF